MEDGIVEEMYDAPRFPWYSNRFLEKIKELTEQPILRLFIMLMLLMLTMVPNLILMLMLVLMLMPGDSLDPPSTKLTASLCAVALVRMRRERSPGDFPLP